MSSQLNLDLKKFLLDAGACLVGYADTSPIPSDVRQDLPVGICIGASLNPDIVRELVDGPTKIYEAEYNRLNILLDDIAGRCVDLLLSKGFKAVTTSATQSVLDWDTLQTPLPHKTVATLAGVGWIGKCALLVTEEFGSALRINTILTDAPLTPAEPITMSRCGTCVECIKICTANAPSGTNWKAGMERSEFFDAFACGETAKQLSRERGIKHAICGQCIAVCPWTEKYVEGGD